MWSWKWTEGSFARDEIVLREKLDRSGIKFFDVAKQHPDINGTGHIEICLGRLLRAEVCRVVIVMIERLDKNILFGDERM